MKRTYAPFILILLLFIAGILFSVKFGTNLLSDFHESDDEIRYNRIISLSPNITETLFALGLGERVVGVTRFCSYPPEALEKGKVGGFIDPNYEAIAALQPDLVILLPEHENVRSNLTELGYRYLIVHNRNVSEILASIMIIGNNCGAENRAREIVSNIEDRMHLIQEKTKGLSQPRVLISIDRMRGVGSLQEVYIAGKNTFYNELIVYAGGKNAYEGQEIAYPVLSPEGLFYINPDIIIDLVPERDMNTIDETMILKEWESVSRVNAVVNNRVYVVKHDFAFIPGPRFILFLEYLTNIIHPEIEESNK
ncbi:MAG TPA: helical backbone metal receptor [Anaerolineae bacterium]|nr:helical backbone metal receptor [Anaerolineae bacterium]